MGRDWELGLFLFFEGPEAERVMENSWFSYLWRVRVRVREGAQLSKLRIRSGQGGTLETSEFRQA